MRSHQQLACVALVMSTTGASAQRNQDENLLLCVGGAAYVGPADSVGQR